MKYYYHFKNAFGQLSADFIEIEKIDNKIYATTSWTPQLVLGKQLITDKDLSDLIENGWTLDKNRLIKERLGIK